MISLNNAYYLFLKIFLPNCCLDNNIDYRAVKELIGKDIDKNNLHIDSYKTLEI